MQEAVGGDEKQEKIFSLSCEFQGPVGFFKATAYPRQLHGCNNLTAIQMRAEKQWRLTIVKVGNCYRIILYPAKITFKSKKNQQQQYVL